MHQWLRLWKVWCIHDREKLPGGALVHARTHPAAVPLLTDPLGRCGCRYIPYVHGWAFMAPFISYVASFSVNKLMNQVIE